MDRLEFLASMNVNTNALEVPKCLLARVKLQPFAGQWAVNSNEQQVVSHKMFVSCAQPDPAATFHIHAQKVGC